MSNRYVTLARGLGRLANGLLTALLPQSCALCGGHAGRWPVCDGCADDLPVRETPGCPRCADDHFGTGDCLRCQQTNPSFDATVAALPYAFPADQLIRQFKYHGRLHLADWLAGWLIAALPAHERFDTVIPVPLHTDRLRERGFNQSAELARRIAPRLAITADLTACIRLRPTLAQAQLDRDARSANVRDAFLCRRDLHGQRILLIDDVMTTGSTADAAALALKQAGADRVVVGLIARAPHP